MENWEVLLRAATGLLISQGENGLKLAIGLLPAYVCRSLEEREVVREFVRTSARLDEAFKILKERLDNPIDEYASILRFCDLKWSPGVAIGDYYYSLLKAAGRARITVRTVCVMLIAQLPKEIQGRLKTDLAEKAEMNEAEGSAFVVKVKTLLVERGLPLDMGYRDFVKIAIVEQPRLAASIQDEGSDTLKVNPEQDVLKVRRDSRKYPTNANKQREIRPKFECYICKSKGDSWKYCPKRTCAISGTQGHDADRCYTADQGGPRTKGKIYTEENDEHENCVSPLVSNNGEETRALLDTGASPAVIDENTLQELGLGNTLKEGFGRVYGLCKNPITVIGSARLTVDVGDGQQVD